MLYLILFLIGLAIVFVGLPILARKDVSPKVLIPTLVLGAVLIIGGALFTLGHFTASMVAELEANQKACNDNAQYNVGDKVYLKGLERPLIVTNVECWNSGKVVYYTVVSDSAEKTTVQQELLETR